MLLTRTLDYKTVSELTETMSSDEYCDWIAEFERSPWDEGRADLRAGLISSTIANYAGKVRKKNSDPAKPIDYMPYHQPEPIVVEPDFEYLQGYLDNAR